MYDLHVHSTYSDGESLTAMVDAAEAAGLDGVGFADHCTVSAGQAADEVRTVWGFNLDLTYERRRRGIERLREHAAVDVYDAVEMDYDPRDEDEIREFLDEADFDYCLGSVHWVEGLHVQTGSNFEGMSDADRDAVVDRYFETLVELVESELFDVAAHADLIERVPALRDRATESHYRRAARAFADSETVPEVNAGRALNETAVVHPSSEFLSVLGEHGVPLTVGSDAHRPDEVTARASFLSEFVADREFELADAASLLRR